MRLERDVNWGRAKPPTDTFFRKQIMSRNILSRLVGAVGFILLSQPSVAQSLGNIAQYPPIPKTVTVTTADAGTPVIETPATDFKSRR